MRVEEGEGLDLSLGRRGGGQGWQVRSSCPGNKSGEAGEPVGSVCAERASQRWKNFAAPSSRPWGYWTGEGQVGQGGGATGHSSQCHLE